MINHYLFGCSFCSTKKIYNCPIWPLTNEKQSNKISYNKIVNSIEFDLIIDTSKEVDWLWQKQSNTMDFAIILVRHPLLMRKVQK